MKQLLKNVKRLALALCLATPIVSWAGFDRTNPVTGETETYTWKFVGTDTWNGTGNWQDSDGGNPSGTPAKTGENTWDPILFDNNDPGNTISINAGMSVEGWNLRMGLYNGASVQMNTFKKIQGGTTMWMTVDETSQLTVGGFGGGNITDNQVIKLSVAKASGIKWNVNLTSGNANNTFEYYLKGNGSVSYQAVSNAYHKIKMADVTLSGGEKSLQRKTLVSFTSSSKAFTADATIKVKNSSGDVVATKNLYSVSSACTITADSYVGKCELVQTSTGIDLYWVDGDAADITPVYKPSISVNFTAGTSLSTDAEVGIGDYAIPGTSWNNLVGNNGSLTTVKGNGLTGATSTIEGAEVTISGTRGYWSRAGVSAANDLRQGYIDDNNNGSDTPTVVVEGIPYDSYKLVVYFSNDTDGANFGYITVNGDNYKGDNGSTVSCDGAASDKWGAANHACWTEGGNYLITPTILNEDGTLTLISHDLSGCRAGVAAIQIVDAYDPSAIEATEVEDGGTYTIESPITTVVKIVCPGSCTIKGTSEYTVTEGDVANLYLDDVVGTVTLGEHTCYTLDSSRTLPGGKIAFDAGSAVAITETRAEFLADLFTVSGLEGVSYVKLTRADGTEETLDVTDGEAIFGSGKGTTKIDGVATMIDATFTNTTALAYKAISSAGIGTDPGMLEPYYNNDLDDETTGMYIRHHPWISGVSSEFNSLSDFTAVVVGQMSPTPKTQFIHMGSSNSAYQGLLIATTANKDEVIITTNTGSAVDEQNAVRVAVPNAASARHAYVIVKSGTTFNVWVDGLKRGSFSVSSNFALGASDNSGLQVGSDFGGAIKNLQSEDKYQAVPNLSAETGVVNVIRVFDYAISDAQAEAVVAAYPYVSEGGLYTRTIEGNAFFYADWAWAKDGDDENFYDMPVSANELDNPSATIDVDDDATLTINRHVTLDTLTVGGSGTLTFDGDYTVKVASAVINSAIEIKYGALDLAGTSVQLGSAGSITFDCSAIDVSSAYTTTRYQLTGLMDRDDDKVVVVKPGEVAYRTVEAEYNENGYYELVVTPDHEAGSEVYYKSGSIWNSEVDPLKVVLEDGETETVVFPGDAVVIDDKSTQDSIYIGELPENVEVIKVKKDATVSGVSSIYYTYMLDGATVTVDDGRTLTIKCNNNDIKLGGVTFDGGDVVLDNNGGTLTIADNVTGSSRLVIAEGANVVIANTAAVENAIVLKAGATLTVPSTFDNIIPTTEVEGCSVKATPEGDMTVWSVAESCSIEVILDEGVSDPNGSVNIQVGGVDVGDSVPYGTIVTVTITPFEGFKIDLAKIMMNDVDITEADIDDPEYDGPIKSLSGTDGGVTIAEIEVTDDISFEFTFQEKNDTVSFTVAEVGNTTVKVIEGDAEIIPEGGVYTVNSGATVKVIWEAAAGYVVTGGETGWFEPTADQEVAAPDGIEVAEAVAKVFNTSYATLKDAVAAAASSYNAEVILLRDITLTERVEPNAGASYLPSTINLNGHTITRTGTSGNGSVFDVKCGTVTIKNGTIDCTQDDTAIVATGVYAITARSGSAVTLEDLTITVDSQAGACVYPFDGATVTINSGIYKNNTAEEYQYKTGWTGMAVNQANVATKLITITGGSFWQVNPEEGDDSGKVTSFLADGYIAKLTDGYWVVSTGTWVAEVGGTKFESLDAAITAATEGQTVKLLAQPSGAIEVNKAITVDGRDFMLTNSVVTDPGAAIITQESTFLGDNLWIGEVIDGVAPNRIVKLVYGETRTVKMDYPNTAVIVEVETGDLVRRVPDDEANQLGGPAGVYFYVMDGAVVPFKVALLGDCYEMGSVTIGESTLDKPTPVVEDFGIYGFLNTYSYTSTEITGDAVTVIEINAGRPVVQIGDAKYVSLQDAVAAAESGDTITVIADSTLRGEIKVGVSLKLDLNGYTVTGAAGDNVMFNPGYNVTFTIKDSSEGATGKLVSAEGKVVCSGNYCTLRIESGTVESTGDVPIGFWGMGGCEVIVNGGTIIAGRGITEEEDWNYGIVATYGEITFNGGVLYAPNCDGFRAFGGVEINGGSVTVRPNGEVVRNNYNAVVNDGRFNIDVKNICADGKTTKKEGEWYVIVDKPAGIDPTAEEQVELDVEPTATQEEAQAAAEGMDVQVTTEVQGVLTEAEVSADDYQGYFTKTAVQNAVTGVWEVQTTVAETVTEDVNEDAAEKLLAAVADAQAETVSVEVPAGLYYKVETFDMLGGEAVDTKTGLSAGATTGVAKPTGTTRGFIRVTVGAAPLQ